MSDSVPLEQHFTDPDVVAATAVRLRRLQIKLYNKSQLTRRVMTPAGQGAAIRQHAECMLIAHIAWALEEGRLQIAAPTEDTMAARMAADVEMHFGTYQEPPPGQGSTGG